MHNRSTSRGPWGRGLGLTLALLGALFLPACSDTTTNVPGGRAQIFVSVAPNPVIGAQSPVGSVSAAYIVTVREIGGVGGGEIQFVNSTVFDPETGLQVAVNYFDSAALVVFQGTNRLDAGGELDITQTTSYTLPDLRVNADLTVAVQFLDDSGILSNQSVLVPIIPAPAE